MLTKERLQATGLKARLEAYWKEYREMYGKDPEDRRSPDTVVGGVIRKAQYQKLVFQSESGDVSKKMMAEGEITTFHMAFKDPLPWTKEGIFFFSDDYTVGIEDGNNLLTHEGRRFIPGLHRLPFQVTPREGLEDGVIRSVDDFIHVFHKNDILIQDMDELLGFINLGRVPENHYRFIDRVGCFITSQWGMKDNPALYTSAHGDKCWQHRDEWEAAGVPFNHGAFIYLMTYMAPYAKEVRETDNGWVKPREWVINYYNNNPAFVELISNVWDITPGQRRRK